MGSRLCELCHFVGDQIREKQNLHRSMKFALTFKVLLAVGLVSM